jgi:hypothetical protein
MSKENNYASKPTNVVIGGQNCLRENFEQMITREHTLQLIQQSFDSLQRSGLLEQAIQVGDGTVLLGAGSPLDSIAFVTFITDLEDRLNRETGQELYLVLGDIHNFNLGNPHLSAGTLAQYATGLTETAKG